MNISSQRSQLLAFFAAALVFTTAILGSLATRPNLQNWYARLAKPSFTPPNWVFGPAWSLLYILMAFAFWLILRLPEAPNAALQTSDASQTAKKRAIGAFIMQLVLNAGWSFAFFAGHSPIAGLIVIIVLLAAIIVTIRLFYPLDRLAAFCLAPYLFWVLFATALNFAIWRSNP